MKLASALFAAGLLTAGTASAGTVANETIAGYTVRVFVPTKTDARALVVMLHGCTQTADAFADATRMDEVAEQNGFVVAYPSQLDSATARCWQWFDPAHQSRDGGEPKAIAEIARTVGAAHGVDDERVYVAGLSAGAAMSVVLGATYPDRFAAIGVVAGVEYKAASSLAGTYTVAGNGGPDPAAQGKLARDAMGSFARAMPAMVFHGGADGVLSSINGRQTADQWRKTNALVLGDGAIDAPTTESDGTVNGYAVTRTVSRSAGSTLVTLVAVDGLGHAWPGGKDGGSYADAKGPDASKMLWSFFAPRTRTRPLAPDGASPPTATPPASAAKDPASPSSAGGDGGGCTIAAPGSNDRYALAVGVAMAILTCTRRRSGMRR